MTLTHCPVKLNFGGDCGKCRYDGGLEYADRFGVYPLRRTRVANCYFALYNPAVTDISAKMRLAPSFAGKIFLDMIEYGADEVSYTLARYKDGGAPKGAVTSGHLFRGVK